MLITFADNIERDVFCFVLRQLIDEFQKDPTRISEKEFFQKKEQLILDQLKKLKIELDEEKSCTQRLLDDKAELMQQLENSQADIEELKQVIQRYDKRENELQDQLEQARESENFFRIESNRYEV